MTLSQLYPKSKYETFSTNFSIILYFSLSFYQVEHFNKKLLFSQAKFNVDQIIIGKSLTKIRFYFFEN